jgi:hypothetical protein
LIDVHQDALRLIDDSAVVDDFGDGFGDAYFSRIVGGCDVDIERDATS